MKRMRLRSFFERPGDGRVRPQIPAQTMMWAELIGFVLREGTMRGIEALVRSPARRNLGVGRAFGDDALGYFEERLDSDRIRSALATAARRAKRNKAFDDSRHVGLALDGTGVCRCRKAACPLCLPIVDAEKKVIGHRHFLSAASIVGAGLTLPIDLEPMRPGEGESAASRRAFERTIERFGSRFFDYVVADGEYASAPFLKSVGERGLRAVIRLKGNVPTLLAQAQRRFEGTPPTCVAEIDGDRVELWDADDFDPWDGLHWESVRVLRYRQHRPDGSVCEAYWLTDWRSAKVGSIELYGMAKSRWEIENQTFNDAKNRYGFEAIRHHQENSLVVSWLLCFLAMTLERLFRLRYLNRGGRPLYSAIALVRQLRLSLGCRARPCAPG